MQQKRLFLAIAVPENLHRTLSDTARNLYPDKGRHVNPELYHLTLHFLGKTPTEKIPGICNTLDSAAAICSPSRISITHTACFQQRNGRLLYAACQCPEIVHDCARFLKEETGYGDRKRFRPHITLIRNLQLKTGPISDNHYHFPASCGFEVHELVLMESIQDRNGLQYPVLHRSPV